MTYTNPNMHEFASVSLDSCVFGDHSIIRKCHGAWGITMAIGMRALLLQALNPVALTGLVLSNPKLFQEPTARTRRTQLAMETIYWGTRHRLLCPGLQGTEMDNCVDGGGFD